MRKFEVVSRCKDMNVKLPERSTVGSAGYDFFAIEDITIEPLSLHKPVLIKTGIKASMEEDEVLLLFNRSSNPIKKGLVLANSVGVIDKSFYNNKDNEGEIGFLFYNVSDTPITINKNDKLGQGIFTKFLITDSDDYKAGNERTGGFGSTGK